MTIYDIIYIKILYERIKNCDWSIKFSCFVIVLTYHENYSTVETPDGWSIYNSLMHVCMYR